MKISYIEQVLIAKILLKILDEDKNHDGNLKIMLNFAELVKQYTTENNAVIFDITEYIYEQLRLVNNEDGAYDDKELRKNLEITIAQHIKH